MTARSWKVTITAPGPWLNANGRRQHRHQTGTRQAWRDATTVAARAARLPALGRAHILATLRFTDNRRRDAANYHPTVKVVVDALVAYGLLPDDSTAYLEGPDLRIGDPLTRKPYGPAGELVLTIRERP